MIGDTARRSWNNRTVTVNVVTNQIRTSLWIERNFYLVPIYVQQKIVESKLMLVLSKLLCPRDSSLVHASYIDDSRTYMPHLSERTTGRLSRCKKVC